MTRSLGKKALVTLVATFVTALSTVGDANAGWFFGRGSSGSSGGWGSSGGSSGGWGSSGGGSSGSWGSSGGWGGRHSWGWRRGHGSSGSWGGWGSSGGSSGGGYAYHSSGGWSGGSSGGSSGGWYGGVESYRPMPGAPVESGRPMTEGETPANPAPPPAPAPGVEGTTPGQPTSASTLLTVNVPADAKIYVNGKLTSTPGTQRQYISRDLSPGYRYTYRVRAEMKKDGKTLAETKIVEIRAGEGKALSFDFNSAVAEDDSDNDSDAATRLTVRLPADAKLFLAGKETRSTGEERTFRTGRMADGQAWDNYTVRAVAIVDGREVTREKTITLKAGNTHELSFDFDAPSLALNDDDQAR
jgi:uncharacterized protein (TIGR03000 family)